MRIRFMRMVSVMLIGIAMGLGLSDIAQAKDLKDYYEEGMRTYNAAQYQEAINAWEGGLNLATNQNNEQVQGIFLGNLGVAYKELGQYQKSLTYKQKAK